MLKLSRRHNYFLAGMKVAHGGFQIHEFESRHEDMVNEPYVQLLAQQLDQCLRRNSQSLE